MGMAGGDLEVAGRGSTEGQRPAGFIRQVLCCVVVSCSALHLGLVTGWPGILVKYTEDPEAAVHLSDISVTWLVSLLGLVWALSSFVTGPLMELVGPRSLLLLTLLPAAVCWLALAFPGWVWVLYLGRVGSCVCAGVLNTVLQPLLAELCHPSHRGFTSSLPEIMVSVGLVYSYVIARLLPWRAATLVCALPYLPLFGLTLLLPESPYWLVRKGREGQAARALTFLDPSCQPCDELSSITSSCHHQLTPRHQLRYLKERRYRRPVILLLVIFLLRELGGPSVIFMYTAYMFSLAGVEMDAYTCSILVGVARLVSTLVSAVVSDRVGRRVLMLVTGLVCSLAEVLAGGVLLLGEDRQGNSGWLSWLPLFGVLLYVTSYGVGLAPVPWVLVGELLPTPIRSLGSAIVSSVFALAVFGISFVFPWLISKLSLGGTFIFFACINVALTLIIFLFLPETKGLSLGEVEKAFNKGQYIDKGAALPNNTTNHSKILMMKDEKSLVIPENRELKHTARNAV